MMKYHLPSHVHACESDEECMFQFMEHFVHFLTLTHSTVGVADWIVAAYETHSNVLMNP